METAKIQNELVSAVITTYKRKPEVIKRAIDSVLNQTYPFIELIVVDDSPNTFEFREDIKNLVSSYNSIKYIQHDVNKGGNAARNTGLNNSNGKYIAFLDDDDEWVKDKIEKQIVKMHDGVGLVTCYYQIITNGIPTELISHNFSSLTYEDLFLQNYIGSASAPLLNKEYIIKVGSFDEKMKSAQDLDLWLRILNKYSYDYVEEPLVLYHIHGNDCISHNYKNVIEGQKRILNKYNSYLKDHKLGLWSRTMRLAIVYFKDGQKFNSFNTWLKCLFIKPLKVKGNLNYFKEIYDFNKN